MKSDMEIQKDVMDQLMWEPILRATDLGVSVKNGVVTLSGMVKFYSQKMAAEHAVKKVAGVKAVAEEIQVGNSPLFRKTDSELAEAVLHALKWNTLAPDDKIMVKVEDGIVSLEGELDWDYQRIAACKSIDNLAGIKAVHNFITLKPAITLADIKQKIRAAFERIATIDAEKIIVEVEGGKVMLSGKVRSFAEQEDAINAAWSAPGISVVENNMELEDPVYAW
ncbi:ornithine aminotransferase [Niastella koreensis]|uniref:Transport-associated protein n=2 Tax=Niastella koreensis TaxID=354356 RepID=G8THY9_NIAKG|nr:BON domain-containing protein [Niastella koreensis]AEV99592.1 transport-associated protein [Niastella koreensis GR20-10]OQP50181.1 ornithine aminotransferase [Niastella koreensis]